MKVYELNSATPTGTKALFATVGSAKARASEVLEEWRESDYEDDDWGPYDLVPGLVWKLETDPEFKYSTRQVLVARYAKDESWAFTITEREVHS